MTKSSTARPARLAGVVLLLAVAGLFLLQRPASAQSAPAIAATPTDLPHVWTISGSGFEPNLVLRVMEIRCHLRPPTLCGGGDSTIGRPVTTSAGGTFEVTLNFGGEAPPEGAEAFIVAAFPGSRALEVDDPTVEIPASAGEGPRPTPIPTVGPPATGTGVDAGDGSRLAWPLIASVAAVAAGSSLVAASRARKE